VQVGQGDICNPKTKKRSYPKKRGQKRGEGGPYVPFGEKGVYIEKYLGNSHELKREKRSEKRVVKKGQEEEKSALS